MTSSRLENTVDIGKRYDVGLDSALGRNVLLVWVDLQHNAGDGFVLAFHQISVVLFVGAYGEILDGYADHVRTGQSRIGCEAMELVQPVVQLPFLVGIQFMLGDIDYFLLMDALIETDQGRKWGEQFSPVLLAHLGVLTTKHVSFVSRPVLENDIPITSDRCRDCV